jgi:hypothetical protein
MCSDKGPEACRSKALFSKQSALLVFTTAGARYG